MWFFRIFGLIVFLCGIGLYGLSGYIKTQVIEGRGQISDARQNVDTGAAILSLDPNTKQVGDQLSSSANKSLDEKSNEADQYDALAEQAKTGGYILMGVGGAIILFSMFLKQSKK
jgi:hypothetical protein